MQTVVVVGASLAGLRGAEALRLQGYDGRLIVVGDEPHPPYDRPPLSKEVLRGDREPEAIALAKPESLADLSLELRTGVAALSLDPARRRVALATGEEIAFDGALLATGARARALPGVREQPMPGAPPLAGVFTLRSLDDCLAIRAALAGSPRVVVVGAGFIGAEVAASCRAKGLHVTVLEALPWPMARVLNADVGGVIAAIHRDHGVDVRLGAGVAGIEGGARVERVRLQDGSCVEADVVVVGIGALPETGWLASSGLALDDGVVCDERCAAAPGVVAAGDVARWLHAGYGEHVRIEHWTNAVEMAEAAAATLLHGDAAPPFAPVPFVWSDQYDVKIQATGRIRPGDDMIVAHGELSERRFVALFGSRGRLQGALAMNRVSKLMGYRRMLREGASWEAAVARAKQG
jgi:3-phenylpropionate/trans-cinnamate dioxygenase ferredoxin reductase subunit